MELNFQDIMSFMDSYRNIQNKEMPLNVAFQFSRFLNEAEKCISFYQDRYNSYLEQYAVKEQDGKFKMNEDQTGIVLKEDSISEAQQKFKELYDYKFPITLEKIPMSSLKELKLSPFTIKGLIPFIKENE